MWTNNIAYYLISFETRVDGNHICGGDSILEGTSAHLPAQCLKRPLGQKVLSWPNRSCDRRWPPRALCSCCVPHASAPTRLLGVSYLLWKAGEKSSADWRKLPWTCSSVEKKSRAKLDWWMGKNLVSGSAEGQSHQLKWDPCQDIAAGLRPTLQVMWDMEMMTVPSMGISAMTDNTSYCNVFKHEKLCFCHGSNADFYCLLTWLVRSCVPLHVSGLVGGG